jgi:hypothetical protein
MRRLADGTLIHRFISALGARASQDVRLYFTGGATAVLFGWRASTIDVDIHLIPEDDQLLRALPELKEELEINVELACPAHFIPELPGWQERSVFITREGQLNSFHYDLYAQALAKIERGHALDVADVQEMFRRGLIEPAEIQRLFGQIVPQLYRYPAIDPRAFRQAIGRAVSGFESSQHE